MRSSKYCPSAFFPKIFIVNLILTKSIRQVCTLGYFPQENGLDPWECHSCERTEEGAET